MAQSSAFCATGTFAVGCNYWASHAGLMMWRQWRADVVAADMKQLAAEGLQVLRVFPLWPDFQPLNQIYSGHGTLKELRMGERALGDSEADRAGVSTEAMQHFAFLADEAEKNGLRLVVGLVTGWMSGRLFVPPAFEGRNVLTDARVLRWQSRFVRYFVKQFKQHRAIVAWDLGNECNCMAKVDDADQAWVWTSLIAGAIRQEDTTRQVVSGMHSLSADTKGQWRMTDQGELTDILTTHPYPIFTPYCNQDPVHYLRNGFHATAESRLYADISGKPCFAEEMGTLGPMVASEQVAADYMRSALFTLWAHDCRAMLWWCAYDQDHLDFAPYERGSCERELGLIRSNREVKPVLKQVGAFGKQIEALPFDHLPPCRREAVCLLTEGQDQWAAAYSAYILAKQAGFDIRFQHADQPLIDSQLYLMPSVENGAATGSRLRRELLERIEAGATLYFSFAGALFQPFRTFFGLDVVHREKWTTPTDVAFTGIDSQPTLRAANTFRLVTQSAGATVLATEPGGNIAFAEHTIGKGSVYYLSFPLETMLSQTPGAFHGESAQPYCRIYQHIAQPLLAQRIVRADQPTVTVTEHELDDGRVVAIIIHHAPGDVTANLAIAPGWRITETWIGNPPRDGAIALPGNDAAVVVLSDAR